MKTARILVVDDDDHVRKALVHELSSDYRVDAVSSGCEAFDALALHQYDVIISDLKMPDHDGIEVLEFARRHQQDAVRVLLTGYVDERAHHALLLPDAPYKVGKPWNDEIEVVVRRGLEQREHARRLCASVEDALSLTTFEDELALTRTPIELAEATMRRALTVEGVTSCATVVRDGGVEHAFTGGTISRDGPGWFLDLPLDQEGDLRLQARGVTESARQLVGSMAHRTRRWCALLSAPASSSGHVRPGGLDQLMRQATLGALTSSLLHDLASTMQVLSGALGEISTYGGNGSEAGEALLDVHAVGEEVLELFVQMRGFLRDGEVHRTPVSVARLVDRAAMLAGEYVRERAQLRIVELPPVDASVAEAMFLQILVNLLRNAANASPQGGVVELRVTANDTEIVFAVTDDGPGIDPEITSCLFEPFAAHTRSGTGMNLAVAEYVMRMLGGQLSYHKDPLRGACFSATIPRHPPALQPIDN
jgi:signal transduction histidine kinase